SQRLCSLSLFALIEVSNRLSNPCSNSSFVSWRLAHNSTFRSINVSTFAKQFFITHYSNVHHFPRISIVVAINTHQLHHYRALDLSLAPVKPIPAIKITLSHAACAKLLR